MKCLKVVGLDRDGGDCECCGRVNLKKLVILREVTADGDGSILRFGSACAARAVNFSVSAVTIETAAKNATDYPGVRTNPVVIGKKPVPAVKPAWDVDAAWEAHLAAIAEGD